ncbi:MAG TPA: ABC transporter ATP-binding protein [Rhabdochlamydiaceae bacterium]|nr:ABC transporter ATP-binding protein [Rhabdochlamydiaceae bacterium]
MLLLLKAALRNRKHLYLLLFSFLALGLLTISNALEISALGVLVNADTLSQLMTGQPIAAPTLEMLGAHKSTNPLQWIIDSVQQQMVNVSSLRVLIGILIGVAIFKAICLFWSRFMTQLMAIRVSRDLRQQYFEHIQTLPMSFYQKHNIGSLSSRVVGDAGQIATSINSVLTNYLHTPFTIILTLVLCFYISWQLSMVIFFGIPMLVLPITFLAKRVKRASRQLQSNQEKFASVLIDFLAGIQTVKIFAMEAFSFKKYKEQNDRMAILESKAAKYGLLTRPVLHMMTTMGLASVVLYGLLTLKLTVSELIVFCGLLQLSYEAIKRFADENANIQRGVVAAERMFDVLNLKPEIEDRLDAILLNDFKEKIEFDHVWFKYQDEWILRDVSFTILKGETVAIVGPTGSGKSTIVQLLPRLYEVQQGEIRIDGKPIDAYTQKSLRDQIAFVSQKPFLFYDTIAANIAFGRSFSRDDIHMAAKRAHAEEFIIRQPMKYDTMLAEAGQNLSGGQQQRLAIARALVKKAPILVLDEATSSLDAISESKIHAAVADLHGEVTQVIIAHRLGTIEHADRIIYIDRGEKIAEGSKAELLQGCDPFRLMWETLYRTEKEPIPTA